MNVASTVAMARLEEPNTWASWRLHTTSSTSELAPERTKQASSRTGMRGETIDQPGGRNHGEIRFGRVMFRKNGPTRLALDVSDSGPRQPYAGRRSRKGHA